MGDVARCLCLTMKVDACPIHRPSGPDPIVPYVLTDGDRQKLREMRISTKDPDDIDDAYRSDLKERR